MTISKMKKQQILEKISELLDNYDSEPSKSFEDHNFRVNSNGWKKITVNGKEYLENKTKDIWELLEKGYKGEQLFTWNAAMRETKKANKRMPTDEEFSEMLKTKDDMTNLVFPGARNPFGAFLDLGSFEYCWSSSVSGGNAWGRFLYVGEARVYRNADNQAYGFSVRCLRD